MTMTVTWINPEDCIDENGESNGKQPSAYSKLNLASLRNRKNANDLLELPTRGYGRMANADGVVENLKHEARTNRPENLCIAVGYEEDAIGYYSYSAIKVELAKPNWQSAE